MRRLTVVGVAVVCVAVVAVAAGIVWFRSGPGGRASPAEPRGIFAGPWMRREPPGRVAAVLLTSSDVALESLEGTPVQTVVGGPDGTKAIRDLLDDVGTRLAPALANGPDGVRDATARAVAALRARLDAPARDVPVRAIVLSWSDGWAFARSLPGFDRYDAIAVFDHRHSRFDAKRAPETADAGGGTRLVVARFATAGSAPGSGPAAGAIEVYEGDAPVASAGPQGTEPETALRHVGIVREQFPGDAPTLRPHGLALTRDGTVVTYGPDVPARRWSGSPRLAEDLRSLLAR